MTYRIVATVEILTIYPLKLINSLRGIYYKMLIIRTVCNETKELKNNCQITIFINVLI